MATKKNRQKASEEVKVKEAEKQEPEVSEEDIEEGIENQKGNQEENREAEKATSEAERAYIRELEERIQELESENSELKTQYLRKQADFENFRKRMQREKKEAIDYANSNLLLDLVSIIDDFERAIKSSEESRDFESFHSGIKLIEKQFVGMLERKYGLTRMESEGKEFDPQEHEAINMEESSNYDVQTVVEEYQRGYKLNERVLRHPKVKVAVPAAPSEDAESSSEEAASSPEEGRGDTQNENGNVNTETNS
ncbi:MAG: nucleotide exchange factor GrpE [Spirochaetaceae bacterium]